MEPNICNAEYLGACFQVVTYMAVNCEIGCWILFVILQEICILFPSFIYFGYVFYKQVFLEDILENFNILTSSMLYALNQCIFFAFLPLQAYRSSMLKAFKKTVDEGAFTFIIGMHHEMCWLNYSYNLRQTNSTILDI